MMFSKTKLLACLCAAGIVVTTMIPSPSYAEEEPQIETTECTQQTQEETEAAETKPAEAKPGETVPGETVPGETVPEETMPEETVPEETVPEETVPEETVPEESVPEEAVPEETEPEEAEPTEAIPAERKLSELLSEQKGSDRILIAENVLVDESVEIPQNVELVIEGGTVRISEAVTLTIPCYAEITGGALIAEDGACLTNMGFIAVKEDGKLLIADDAEYAQDEGAVLQLEKTEDGEESIVGISPENMECTVYVTTVNKLIGALSTNDYAYLTIMVDGPDIVSAAGITEIPDNICICQGG